MLQGERCLAGRERLIAQQHGERDGVRPAPPETCSCRWANGGSPGVCPRTRGSCPRIPAARGGARRGRRWKSGTLVLSAPSTSRGPRRSAGSTPDWVDPDSGCRRSTAPEGFLADRPAAPLRARPFVSRSCPRSTSSAATAGPAGGRAPSAPRYARRADDPARGFWLCSPAQLPGGRGPGGESGGGGGPGPPSSSPRATSSRRRRVREGRPRAPGSPVHVHVRRIVEPGWRPGSRGRSPARPAGRRTGRSVTGLMPSSRHRADTVRGSAPARTRHSQAHPAGPTDRARC